MKKVIYFVSLIAVFCSCSHDGELYSYETVNANLDKYLTDKAYPSQYLPEVSPW